MKNLRTGFARYFPVGFLVNQPTLDVNTVRDTSR